MVSLVLDTSVLIAGIRSSGGASNLLLRLAMLRRVTPRATVPLFLEYEDVLKRPAQMQAHGLSSPQVDAFLAALAGAIDPVEVHFGWRPQLDDAGDEMVLEAAVNGRADAIVTFNLRHLERTAGRFGIAAVTPHGFLERFKP